MPDPSMMGAGGGAGGAPPMPLPPALMKKRKGRKVRGHKRRIKGKRR